MKLRVQDVFRFLKPIDTVDSKDLLLLVIIPCKQDNAAPLPLLDFINVQTSSCKRLPLAVEPSLDLRGLEDGAFGKVEPVWEIFVATERPSTTDVEQST